MNGARWYVAEQEHADNAKTKSKAIIRAFSRVEALDAWQAARQQYGAGTGIGGWLLRLRPASRAEVLEAAKRNPHWLDGVHSFAGWAGVPDYDDEQTHRELLAEME